MLYKATAYTQTTSHIQSSCNNKTLKVLPSFSDNKLHSTSMWYFLGEHNSDTFTVSKWSDSPNHSINKAIVAQLQSSGIFKEVLISGSRANSELYLESSINEFLQHFSQDEKSSKAKLNIRLTLVDAKTKEVIASKTFKESIDVKAINAKGGVIALDKALSLFLEKQALWLQKSCK